MSLSIETLKQKLGECKRLECRNCLTKSPYETLSKKEFFVFDDRKVEGPVKIVDKHSDYQLTVSNRNRIENEICLIKTDGCLFFTSAHQKCDCVLFNTRKIFFVELSETGASNKSDKRKDAINQLGTTIEKFKENQIDFSDLHSEAIICFKSGHRPTHTAFNSQKAIFFDKHKVILDEINKISFDAED
jgi:hypothetical protein